ncbi:hypothetical protein JTE88_07530 [Arcanobacterium phocisimile]|uniref:Uncharacterized protein n=1 Tax=Arcanobacterium phocisimile TaxID=1302235 RepID=A0ABX7IG17_9ACTO|nr:hypothetical protein [Arcanobacterium phocisimile]QRV01921.1 hypothetical protein JTE88_07530 [Arcanobacterium phocisimile]
MKKIHFMLAFCLALISLSACNNDPDSADMVSVPSSSSALSGENVDHVEKASAMLASQI